MQIGVGPSLEPESIKQKRRELRVRLPQRPLEAKHNHDPEVVRPHIVYAGMSKKAPGNHLFKCTVVGRRKKPCPWTSIELCYDAIGLNIGMPLHKRRPCPTCRAFERRRRKRAS